MEIGMEKMNANGRNARVSWDFIKIAHKNRIWKVEQIDPRYWCGFSLSLAFTNAAALFSPFNLLVNVFLLRGAFSVGSFHFNHAHDNDAVI